MVIIFCKNMYLYNNPYTDVFEVFPWDNDASLSVSIGKVNIFLSWSLSHMVLISIIRLFFDV